MKTPPSNRGRFFVFTFMAMSTETEQEYFTAVERILYIERWPDANENTEHDDLLNIIDEYETFAPYKGSYRERRNEEEQWFYNDAMKQHDLEISIQEPFDVVAYEERLDKQEKEEDAEYERERQEYANLGKRRKDEYGYQDYLKNGWDRFVEDGLDGERSAGWNLY